MTQQLEERLTHLAALMEQAVREAQQIESEDERAGRPHKREVHKVTNFVTMAEAVVTGTLLTVRLLMVRRT